MLFCKWPSQPGSNRELFWTAESARRTADNPSVKQFMDNTMSLRQQGSAALPVRGNSSRKRLLYPDDMIENDPIPKRRRGSQSKSDK